MCVCGGGGYVTFTAQMCLLRVIYKMYIFNYKCDYLVMWEKENSSV